MSWLVHELGAPSRTDARRGAPCLHWGLDGACVRLTRRQDELDAKVQTLMALGWDHVALARRLASLEDQVAVLTGSTRPRLVREVDPHPSILFPGLDSAPVDDRAEDVDRRPRELARVADVPPGRDRRESEAPSRIGSGGLVLFTCFKQRSRRSDLLRHDERRAGTRG